jgi:hypothetical protein
MPIDPRRVQSIFLAAIETSDPAVRAAVVERECGANAELRRRVEATVAFNRAGTRLVALGTSLRIWDGTPRPGGGK